MDRNIYKIPMAVMSDSYKAGHSVGMYLPCKSATAYGEFRSPFVGLNDERIVFYGIRYIVENYISKQWTEEDVEKADIFYKTHNVPFSQYPFPKDLFLKFIRENNGYMPIKIEALPEGSVVFAHTPVYQITAGEGTKVNDADYARLVTFMETILTQVWYPSNVATLSRHVRKLIQKYFSETVEQEEYWLLDSRLHDFGMRGCASIEQTVTGGVAHLLSFIGSDTMPACYYAQFELNGGNPVAMSIPATEHSVMTSWPTELEAVQNMVESYGSGLFATVADSYDYINFLETILPLVAPRVKELGGTHIVRPDSGDPVECVLSGLEYCGRAYGYRINSKGYKVLYNSAVIQGDGINYHIIKDILEAVKSSGWSVQNVAFGMGGGLLQKHNRDTMSFATKLSHLVDINGVEIDVYKHPKDDSRKFSLPGKFEVVRENGIPYVYPIGTTCGSNELKVIYDCGPIDGVWDKSFSITKERLNRQWNESPEKADVITLGIKNKIQYIVK